MKKKLLFILLLISIIVVNVGEINGFKNSKKEIETETKNIEFMTANSADLEIDFGLKEYAVHESENIVFYLTLKNNSDKASDYMYVQLRPWPKAVRVLNTSTKDFKDSVTYKIGDNVSTVSIKCLRSCEDIDGAVAANETSQILEFRLGQVPAKTTATFEVKYKYVGEVGQDTMYGTLKKMSADVKGFTDSGYSNLSSTNQHYKVLTFNVMKSLNRQEITITDSNGKVINDLHDLPLTTGNDGYSATLKVKFKKSGQFGDGLTYYSEELVKPVARPTLANEASYYSGYNNKLVQIRLPEDSTYGNVSSLTNLNLERKGNLIFNLVYKEPNIDINETASVPITIPKEFLNKQICITPYQFDSTEDAWSKDTSGLSGVNEFCIGPYLNINAFSATKTGTDANTGKMKVDLKISIKNKNTEYAEGIEEGSHEQTFTEGNGRANGAVVAFRLPDGVSLGNFSDGVYYNYDSAEKVVRLKTGEIKYNLSGTVTVPLLVNNDVTSIAIPANYASVEDKEYKTAANVAISGLEPPTSSTGKPGDWDQNGTVDINDVIYCASYIAKIDTARYKLPDSEIIWNLATKDDAISNGKPNVNDLTALVKGIAYKEL
ncbi:MAG: hypothetical protein IJO33_02730 [Bacilli bacterium]|nr:hypothetical protein [Bacilli bacterium]